MTNNSSSSFIYLSTSLLLSLKNMQSSLSAIEKHFYNYSLASSFQKPLYRFRPGVLSAQCCLHDHFSHTWGIDVTGLPSFHAFLNILLQKTTTCTRHDFKALRSSSGFTISSITMQATRGCNRDDGTSLHGKTQLLRRTGFCVLVSRFLKLLQSVHSAYQQHWMQTVHDCQFKVTGKWSL